MSIIKNLSNLPVAVAGLALGVAGIGNVLGLEVHIGFRYGFALIALFLLILVAAKKLAHPQQLINEISHPVAGSFIPAFDMCLMVIADLITRHSLLLGQILWIIAISLHAVFAISFFYHRAKSFDINHMLPSWFVPPVGIVVACVTSANMGFPELAHNIFYIGFILYVIMLPIMLYRLIFGDKIHDNQLPAFAVVGAPASLCLAGYLTAFANPNPVIVNFLLPVALSMTLLVYLSIIRVNPYRISFIPIYASYTFPLAIGATALLKYAKYVGQETQNGQFWYNLALAETVVAVMVILWVLINMLKVVSSTVLFPKQENIKL